MVIKKIIILVSGYVLLTYSVQATVYQCVDGSGQRIFSDKPCAETSMGNGLVGSYGEETIAVKKIPTVLDDQMANRIRSQLTPAQIKEKYCAKYNQSERDRLVLSKQVVLGMELPDVIKVWGAPLSSDGNKVLFQDNEDEVTVTLLEGCVINIQRNLDDEEYINEDFSD